MIRFAIIGSGGIAAMHAKAIAAATGAELGAVWSREAERGKNFAKNQGVDFVADASDLAAREDIHAATIATPSGAHAQAALPFLKNGKAVLCEKPLETSLEKADEMLDAAKKSGAILAGVFQLRLGLGAHALKRAIHLGRFGRLSLCSAYIKWWREQSYYDSGGWRGTWNLDGGGALMNQGVHGVDLLQWFVGMPSEVFAFSGRVAHERIEVEDTICVALKFPNGAMGVIEASTACKPGTALRIEICGEKGCATLEDDRIVRWEFEEWHEEDEKIRNLPAGAIVGGTSDPGAIGFEGHRILVEDLVRSIIEKRPPMVPGAEARNAVRLILAAYESASAKRVISLRG